MTEVLTDLPESSTSVEDQSAPESFRGRLRRGAHEAYNILDLSAGVALANIDIRTHTDTMESLNNRYNGLLERRTASDRISMALQSDIQLDFRRDAQRAGFTDVNQMPTDQRREVAEAAAAPYLDDIITELQAHHPDWTAEEVEALAQQYTQDIITILAMDETQRDTYQAAMLEYRESGSAITEAEQRKEELQEQRNQHLRSFGRVAMQTLVAMAHSVRSVPYAVGARVSVTVVQVRDWYGNRSPEGKKAVWFSAASVAVAGLVGYLATRHTGGAHGGGYNLASYDVSGPDAHSVNLGDHRPDQLGFSGPNNLGQHANHPTNLGDHLNRPIGLGQHVDHPNNLGDNGHPGRPYNLGQHANHPDNLGQHADHPNNLGDHRPDNLGTPGATPEVHTSAELFSDSGEVNKWPDTITVSHWNSKTHDGSLWGISEQMLRRSGVEHPDDGQIQHLVNALRPQAQPNGFLLDGQQLHLGPAVDALKDLK